MSIHTRYNSIKYQVISFGFCNISAGFEGFINMIFIKKLDIFVIVYLYDNLIYIDNLGYPYIEAI